MQDKSVLSAAVVKEGGAAAAVCKMAFGSKLGFTFAQGLDAATLFAPYEGSFCGRKSPRMASWPTAWHPMPPPWAPSTATESLFWTAMC